jgi:deoxyribodipyrimidine photo-lyase
VDETAALAHAKAVLYGLRATPQARAEADAVQQQHGSRKSGLPPSGARPAANPAAKTAKKRKATPGASPPSRQGELF